MPEDLPICPICKTGADAVSPELRHCRSCGTLIHATGKAWFRDGAYSVPSLVQFIRENNMQFADSVNVVREFVGLPRVQETEGVR